MRSHWTTSVVMLLCAQLVGCKDDPSGNAEDTTGPGPTTQTEGPTSMTMDPETTLPDPTADTSESSVGPVVTDTDPDTSTTGEIETESESETETSGPLACVNEDIGSAVGSSVLTGTTAGEDSDLASSCSEGGKKGGPAPDYIVSWTAPEAGDYTFSLLGSEYDTLITVFDGDCNGPELGCNDDCEDLQSVLGLTVEAGQVVLIAISGYGERAGAFELGITAEVAPQCGGFETDTATVSTTDTDSSSATDPSATTDPTSAGSDEATTVSASGDGDGG